MTRKWFKIEAGIGLRPDVRSLLSLLSMDNPDLHWSESKGWLTSVFLISVPESMAEWLETRLRDLGDYEEEDDQ